MVEGKGWEGLWDWGWRQVWGWRWVAEGDGFKEGYGH